MSFGTRLKMLRVKYKLDQGAMSRRLHVSQPVYSRYENDAKAVEENSPFVMRVAETFNISGQWLIRGDEEDLLPGKDGASSVINKEEDYTLPQAFADILRKQQELNDQIFRMLLKNNDG